MRVFGIRNYQTVAQNHKGNRCVGGLALMGLLGAGLLQSSVCQKHCICKVQ